MFKNKSILITGGTGSFGKAFVEYALKKNLPFRKVIIFSRDEFKQYNMFEEFKISKFKNLEKLRFFLGDIRDKDRIRSALGDVDYVVHAAALKQVPAAEYNPIEFIKTNILGAQNLISTCADLNINKIVTLSTDKAVAPKNLYGATKLCSDKLFIAANNTVGKRSTTFSVARYGNVIASRGSVIPLFMSYAKLNAPIPVTNLEMTRFCMTMDDSIKMVLWVLKNSKGGEIFIPKIPSYKLDTLVKAIVPKKPVKIIGLRVGEKLHEELISREDSRNVYDFGKYYALITENFLERYSINLKKIKIKKEFSYNSFDNNRYLSVKNIQELIKKNFKIFKNDSSYYSD